MNTADALREIFLRHRRERVCVLATTCCGKSTLHGLLPGTADMDDALWPLLSKEEEARFCQRPWTPEIGRYAARLTRERVRIRPGEPMFSVILLECDLAVYIDISDAALEAHCRRRNASFDDAKKIRAALRDAWERKRAEGGASCFLTWTE